MNHKEFLAAIDQIEYEKGIPKEEIMSLIESAVRKALEKHFTMAYKYNVTLSRETGKISASGIKKVVGKVSDPRGEIDIKEGRKIKEGVCEGEELEIPIDVSEIARIASLATEKIISQRIREREKESLYKKYCGLKGKVLKGRVFRFIGRKAIMDLNDIEGILMPEEQVPRQFLKLNSYVWVYVLDVVGSEKKFEVFLSRTHPDFIKGVLTEEVPELKSGEIEVIKIVRSPGFKTKILLHSKNPKVDPVGSCVGVRGMRIRNVINELKGEKIDVVNADIPLERQVVAALGHPQGVIRVEVDGDIAKVFATASAKPQIIGSSGENLALAERLLNCKIEVIEEQNG